MEMERRKEKKKRVRGSEINKSIWLLLFVVRPVRICTYEDRGLRLVAWDAVKLIHAPWSLR
jgi:hypothetical protein